MLTNKILKFSFFALSLLLILLPAVLQAQTITDSTELYTLVKTYQDTFNTRSAKALSAFFTEDADVVVGNLLEAKGRQAIENFWRNYWRSKFNKQQPGRRGTFTVNSVRKITSDIALINLLSVTAGQDTSGKELRTRKARGTWVVHRVNGEWLIASVFMMPAVTDSVVLKTTIETAESLQPNIRAFVDDYEDAFNSHDPSAVSTFFRSDADIIVRNLPLIQSKQAIQNWWNNYFSKPRSYKALFIIDEIRTISDDVAQVNFTVTGAFPEAEDKLQPVRQTSAMWILVREAGKWRIAALRVLPGKDDLVIRK
jgi:uncharacterized protein (TIGR02246 family)